MYPVGVIHGRFQPLHHDHVKYIAAGMERCGFLYVGITNPDPGLTRADAADAHRSLAASNPCTYYERLLMVRGALQDAGYGPDRFCVVPFPINLPELWRFYAPPDAVYFLTIYDTWGERKLQLLSDKGLRTEVMWCCSTAEKGITGLDVRQRIADGREWEHLVPSATRDVIRRFCIDQRIQELAHTSIVPAPELSARL